MGPVVFPEIVGPGFQSYWSAEMTHEEYHADKTAINSSILKLFDISPAAVEAHYLTHETIEDEPEAEHFTLGRAIHAAALEPKRFVKIMTVAPEFKGEGSRKAKKEWMDAQPKGAMILKPKQHLQLTGMINSILNYPDAVKLLNNGCPEITGYYRDPDTGIKGKIRPDLWNEELGILLDIKSCVDSSPRVFSRKIFEYGYHLSMAMYSTGIQQITGNKPNYCIFLAIEKKPPYERALYVCTEMMLQKGFEEYKYRMEKFKYCLENKSWPYRQSGMDYLDLPEYAYRKEFEE